MLSGNLASKAAEVIRNAGAGPNKEKAGAATPAFGKMSELTTNDTNIVTQAPSSVKIAAIYCRVSTDKQEEHGTSLDTQREACLKYCQEHGYTVTHQFIETWSGLTLDRPKLNELRDLVRNYGIDVIVFYTIDRLSRNATHGVILRDETEKHHIELLSVTEDLDNSPLGKAITYLRGTFAEIEAEKIKERTSRGIKALVFDKGKPVNYSRAPYGYKWNKADNSLEPDNNYNIAQQIFTWAKDGKSYDWIINELKRRGIESPTGKPLWNKHTISTMLRNPVYTGKYFAFKSVATEPVKRENGSCGKSSQRRLPQSEWHHVPDIRIIDPIITPADQELLISHIERRSKLASRNAKRDYLLRGMILCGTHYGENGRPRVYHGTPKRDTYYYACPVGGCVAPYIPGPDIEYFITGYILNMFMSQPPEFYTRLAAGRQNTRKSIERELKRLENSENTTVTKLAKLEDRYIAGEYDATPDVYEMLKAKYQAQRGSSQQRRNELLDQLSQLGRENEAASKLADIMSDVLVNFGQLFEPFKRKANKASPEIKAAWRKIFSALNLEIHIHPDDAEILGLNHVKLGQQVVNIELKMGLWLPIDTASDIALHGAGNAQRNLTYFPISFNPADYITKGAAYVC